MSDFVMHYVERERQRPLEINDVRVPRELRRPLISTRKSRDAMDDNVRRKKERKREKKSIETALTLTLDTERASRPIRVVNSQKRTSPVPGERRPLSSERGITSINYQGPEIRKQ